MDRVENRIQNARHAIALRDFGGAQQRIQIAMRGGNQHGRGAALLRDVDHSLLQAEQEIGARASAAREFGRVRRIDADAQSSRLERADAVLEMGKRRIRQATKIDDIRARGRHRKRAIQDLVDRQSRGVDDLGEDADVMTGKIDLVCGRAEKRRQIVQLIGAAFEDDAEFGGKRRQIRAATSGDDDAGRLDRARQPA